MRQAEARRLWEQGIQKNKESHLGTRCLRILDNGEGEQCIGHYTFLTKPYTPEDFPGEVGYLECDTCGSHLLTSTFKRWLSSRRRQAKRHVKDSEARLNRLKKELEQNKEYVAVERNVLKVAKQEQRKWGY